LTEEKQGGTAPDPEAIATDEDQAPEPTVAAVAVADEPATDPTVDVVDAASAPTPDETSDTPDAANAAVVDTEAPEAAAAAEPVGPDAAHLRAQDRVLAAGGKLSDQEKFKRELHPFDGYERLKAQAAQNEPPKPPDNFRWRFFGLFYVAPNQNSYMCRLRIPNGIVKAAQFTGLADLAERYGGGYAHVTTRANIQIREIKAANASPCLRRSRIWGCARAAPAPTTSAT